MNDIDDNRNWPFVPRWRPIPEMFHSLERDGPFTVCMLCEQDLTCGSRPYVVERIFRGTEPILECAICMACQQGMCDDLSQESLARIEGFFAAVDHEARFSRLRHHVVAEEGIGPWVDTCLITGKRREDCRGYQIIGLCDGLELQLSATPFMLSDDAVQQLTKVLSKQTRDRLDDFTGQHFGMPPEFCEQPDYFPVLF